MKHYKWRALFLLSIAYFLLQGARQIYNVTLPQIRVDFAGGGISSVQLGMVGSTFLLVYGISVPFAGVLADFFRRKWVVVAGVTLFSAGICLSGFATSVGFLMVAYGLMNGIGQCMVPTSSASLITQLHPDTRATALSLYQMALFAGIILCGFFSGCLGALGPGGWRWAFWIFGGVGLAWTLVLTWLLRDTAQPATQVSARQEKPRFAEAFSAFFAKPSALLMTLAFGAQVFCVMGFRAWIPTCLQNRFGVAPAAAAFHAVFWFHAGAFLGIWVASRLSDKQAPRHPGVRLVVNAIGLAGCAPFVLLVSRTGALVPCCAVMALYGIMHGVYDANFFASLYDVVVPRYRASATGFFLCGAFRIGCTSPTVIGWVGDRLSFSVGFAVLSLVYLIGAAASLLARVRFFPHDRNLTEG